MVARTRKASNVPRKRKPSSKLRANQETPPSKRIKKLQKGKKWVHPEELNNSSPEPSESSDEVEEPLEDPLQAQYTLIWTIMIDGIQLDSDTERYKLSEFK